MKALADRLYLAALIATGSLLMTAGCDKAEKQATTKQNCDARLPATGERHKVPNPVRPSFCTGPVMWCSYCEYAADGALIDSSSRPCGVCLQGETK